MGVDLKVHVYKGFLIAKASWVPTWDPAKVFFWVREKQFLAKNMANIHLDEVAYAA